MTRTRPPRRRAGAGRARARDLAETPGAAFPAPTLHPPIGTPSAISLVPTFSHRVGVLFGTALGVGYFPYAQGTVACAWSLVAAYVLDADPVRLAVFAAATSAVCVWAGKKCEELYAVKDPHPVVLDEVAGMAVALLFHPVSWVSWPAAFLFFRFFDVKKPLGIRALQRLPGGWGILVDDLLAGAAANACVFALEALL